MITTAYFLWHLHKGTTGNLYKMLDDLRQEAQSLGLNLSDAINRLAGYRAVQIMSGHASKGREFDYVFLAGLEDNVLPFYKTHDNEEELAEERRIFYVSVTRARKAVYLTSAAKTTGTWKRQPSRFIRHIPEELFCPIPE
jgi:DNA helicase-2/ATP-dependent DNA helicase PcrA